MLSSLSFFDSLLIDHCEDTHHTLPQKKTIFFQNPSSVCLIHKQLTIETSTPMFLGIF